ncbi:copper chaperone PCu(A)C [Aquihabitans sp. G128]|uniref:copper chaperone PCu(A)C n=1 Tax=Aquihabitans sp. G128 TaxID=2849779 RepID=UPI001C2148E5|nr:copper chaperone PCu(A)C [Aquihabitans sp. G128]QXC62547.1 copper chaperone PCu(A)C [Aquihabitans sp. G128]
MSRLIRLVLMVSALVVLPLAGCGSGDGAKAEASGELRVLDATVEVPPNPTTASIRMVVDNGTGTDDELVGVASSVADTVSVHRSETDAKGLATMVPVKALKIPARSKVTFEPGGLHVMLEGLSGSLKAGTTIKLKLTFAHAGSRTATVRVVPFGSTTSDSSAHDMEH